VMYQSFLTPSHRAPRALTASFSAKGVTKLILMAGLSLGSSDEVPLLNYILKSIPYNDRHLRLAMLPTLVIPEAPITLPRKNTKGGGFEHIGIGG
jgi:hypothetical protein